jgi:acetylornithine/succinyldiaminopimelate/putrescine aminotransferase
MKPLRQKFLEHIAQTSPSPMAIEVERAEGVYLRGPDGKRWFDLVSGVSVSNVGHANPRVVEAVQRQAGQYLHLMVYGEVVQSPQVEYAVRLTELLPAVLNSVYFVNSGAEAIEGALKLAKRYTGRSGIAAFDKAYHGSTHGAMSVMGGGEYTRGYGPLLPGVAHLSFNDPAGLEKITGETACVIVEPVQGEAGIRLPEPGFLAALRRRCTAVGALLIFDEIQTGMGRTGTMFALRRYGVEPDIVCLAKALGGGMPLGAFISSRQIMGVLSEDPALGHITTFGGHPVCCAAGLAALEFILDNRVLDNVEPMGALYEQLLSSHPAVGEIRRAGLLMAVELGSPEKMHAVVEGLLREGVMSDWFLFCDTAFRISPPLVITEAEVRESCVAILRVLDEVE